MTILRSMPAFLGLAFVLLSMTPAAAQVPGAAPKSDDPLAVTLSAKKLTVMPFQGIDLTLTVTNNGDAPSPALTRAMLAGPKTLVCAGPPTDEMVRKGEWAILEGKQPSGSIGPLLPGESFTMPLRIRIPEALESKPGQPVYVQWVGRSGPLDKLRSNEITVSVQDGHLPIATVETSQGTIVMELWPDRAPNHVANFIQLARSGFYDDNLFHRVVRNFVIQTGGGDGTKDPGYCIPAEFNDADFKKGVLGMARAAEPDSASSQWFICVADQPALTGKYTAFGRVLEGQEVADRISFVPVQHERPMEDVVVKRVIVETPRDYVMPALVKAGDGKSGGESR